MMIDYDWFSGHVFSWPHILRYLAYSEKGFRRCPVCFDSVTVASLKSAQIVHRHYHRAGDHVHFVLVKREKVH